MSERCVAGLSQRLRQVLIVHGKRSVEEASALSEKDIKAAEERQKQLERERELAIERALSSRM